MSCNQCRGRHTGKKHCSWNAPDGQSPPLCVPASNIDENDISNSDACNDFFDTLRYFIFAGEAAPSGSGLQAMIYAWTNTGVAILDEHGCLTWMWDVICCCVWQCSLIFCTPCQSINQFVYHSSLTHVHTLYIIHTKNLWLKFVTTCIYMCYNCQHRGAYPSSRSSPCRVRAKPLGRKRCCPHSSNISCVPADVNDITNLTENECDQFQDLLNLLTNIINSEPAGEYRQMLEEFHAAGVVVGQTAGCPSE